MVDKNLIVDAIYAGSTLLEIAKRVGCSREYVRQVAVKRGAYAEVLRRREDKRARRAEAFSNRVSGKYGIPMSEAHMLRKMGVTRAYTYQKNNAKHRGIEWRFTLQSWWKVWLDSGRWAERGRGGQRYVMARFGDSGAYEPGNVYICTCGENAKEMQAIRKALKHLRK